MNCPKKFHERNWVSSFKPVILSYSWLIAEIACQNPANETKDFNKTKKKKNSNISHNGSQIWKFNFEILLPHYLFVLLFLISLHCQFHRCMQQLPQLTSWTNKSHYIKCCQCAALLRLILSSLEFVLKKKRRASTCRFHDPVTGLPLLCRVILCELSLLLLLYLCIVFVSCIVIFFFGMSTLNCGKPVVVVVVVDVILMSFTFYCFLLRSPFVKVEFSFFSSFVFICSSCFATKLIAFNFLLI